MLIIKYYASITTVEIIKNRFFKILYRIVQLDKTQRKILSQMTFVEKQTRRICIEVNQLPGERNEREQKLINLFIEKYINITKLSYSKRTSRK